MDKYEAFEKYAEYEAHFDEDNRARRGRRRKTSPGSQVKRSDMTDFGDDVVERTGDGPVTIGEHICEIVSDSGEGAQKCGQIMGLVSGKMGNGVWTVEIIPAEIQPPARERQGASGIRVRMGSKYMTNMGDEADIVVAFNEQVLYSRISNRAR